MKKAYVLLFCLIAGAPLSQAQVCAEIMTGPARQADALELEYQRLDAGLGAIVPKSRRFLKSREEFTRDISKAKRYVQHGTFNQWELEKPQVHSELYRIGGRGPDEIKRNGGLFANTGDKVTGVVEHIQNGGGAGYVSFSWEHNPNVLFNIHFFPKNPKRLFGKGRLSEPMTADDWGELTRKTWPLGTTDLPEAAVFEVYEYRAKNIFGVAVLGGRYGSELEVITQGVKLAQGIEWRRITVKIPIQYMEIIGPNGVKVLRVDDNSYNPASLPTLPGLQVVDPPKDWLKISEWQRL